MASCPHSQEKRGRRSRRHQISRVPRPVVQDTSVLPVIVAEQLIENDPTDLRGATSMPTMLNPLADTHSCTFHPSSWEFQRRGEEEMAKFFHLVINHATKKTIGHNQRLVLKYHDPNTDTISSDASTVLGTSSLDFHWQMKHFSHDYNTRSYAKYVFNSSIQESDIHEACRILREEVDQAVHKQRLYNTHHKPTTTSSDLDRVIAFLDTGIQFLNKIHLVLSGFRIKGLLNHFQNVQHTHKSLLESKNFRSLTEDNSNDYKRMDTQKKMATTRKVLDHMTRHTSEAHQHIIGVALASHCDISIKDLPQCESFQSYPKADTRGGPLGALERIQDALLGTQYTLDPFCPSSIEIQWQAEDAMVLFFRAVLKHLTLPQLSYHDTENHRFITITEALKGPSSYDFHSLMNHFQHNASQYTQFGHQPVKTKAYCDLLKRIASELNHDHHYSAHFARRKWQIDHNPEMEETLQNFLEYGTDFVDQLCTQLEGIAELEVHQRHLHQVKIEADKFIKYRRLHRENSQAYDKMSKEQRSAAVQHILSLLETTLEHHHEAIQVQLAARFKIKLSK